MSVQPTPQAPDDSAGGLTAGRWAIAVMLVLAVAASAASWVYYARLQRRPLEAWGSAAAQLMLRAPQATALRLAPIDADEPPADDEVLTIAGTRRRIVERRDVAGTRGFSHIRQCLVHDASFAWDAAADECQPDWDYALEFVDGSSRATLALATGCGRAALVASDATVSMRPVMAEIESFLQEQFPGGGEQNPAARDAGSQLPRPAD